MAVPAIRTTVVGSYPVPDWLAALPSQQALIDATRVVFKTQEMAGIDVVADGELYRFDVNHPDTNGMIEYFIRPMSGHPLGRHPRGHRGIRPAAGHGLPRRARRRRRRARSAKGTLNLPRDYRRARGPDQAADEVHPDRPAHAVQDADGPPLPRQGAARAGHCGRLAEQVADIDPDVIQVDEANIPGTPEEGDWAAERDQRRARCGNERAKEKGVHMCFGNYGGQSIQTGRVAEADASS